jgi:hypothetical protein
METPVYGIIYGLFFPNGRYIGQTIQGKNVRWKEHLRDTNAGSKLPVHNAIRKYYNIDATKNKVQMIVIDKAYSLEELNKLETEYIIKYDTFNNNGNNPNGYNMTMGGDGCKGYKFTEEQKENSRKIQQKRKEEYPEIAINHSKFMKKRAIDNPNIGIQHSIDMTQFYIDNPSKRKEMSTLKKQQYKDNPEMAIQQSELKLMRYEDKDAVKLIANISKKTTQQWQDPEKRKKIMDEKRNRFSKPFNVYKDGILIGSFDYVPDCASKLFGKENDSNISAVLNGRKKLHKGYLFEYKL